MTKKEISYTDLVKIMLTKARKDASSLGGKYSPKEAFSSAASRWKQVKDGSDPEFSQVNSTTKPVSPAPGHKGAPSITRPGHKDFRTAKGFKYYHRDGHLEDYNAKGVKGTPYTKKQTRKSRKKTGKRKSRKKTGKRKSRKKTGKRK